MRPLCLARAPRGSSAKWNMVLIRAFTGGSAQARRRSRAGPPSARVPSTPSATLPNAKTSAGL
ncbi:hypothetical protein [Streptomyces sp. NPDC020597]|uniref:hypothetical protein n=1 Tax=unclassified Streptomyces TaxID=2593676 RepID=UPI0037B8309A